MSLTELLSKNRGRQFDLHMQFVNPQMARMLHLVGMDTDYVRAQGCRLYDSKGNSYLDLLTHCGVFSIGHNHPHAIKLIQEVVAAELPNILAMDCSLLSGLLAERLVALAPHLGRVFFTNSGTEATEAALKMARGATNRPRIVSFVGGYHGLSYGALSTIGHEMWRDNFAPFLPGCTQIAFNDLPALEAELKKGDVACLIGETILGEGGVLFPKDGYWKAAGELCKRYGTLLILDEIQVGLGRTGKMFAYQHYNVEPDMLLIGKALSGGLAPVAAAMMRTDIFDKVFSRLDKCFVHCGTYNQNNIAMAAGMAVLDVIEQEKLVAQAAEHGSYFLDKLKPLAKKYELIHDVRGLGMIIGVEYGRPKSFGLKMGWDMLSKANEGLFGQMIVLPMYRDHKIMIQVAAHPLCTLKIMPPLALPKDEIDRTVAALDKVTAEAHRFPGGVWTFGMDLIKRALL